MKPKGITITFSDTMTTDDFNYLMKSLTQVSIIKDITIFENKIADNAITRCENLAKKKLKKFYDEFNLIEADLS